MKPLPPLKQMTNETKLLKLLQVAQSNGWKDTYGYLNATPIIESVWVLYPEYENSQFKTGFSLNDLVTNFEPNEVSFIDALHTATCTCLSKDDYYNHINNNGLTVSSYRESVCNGWTNDYTSQRLDWLFETFTHLL